MASSAITSREIDGETVTNLIFLDFKITADGDCSPEIKTLAPCKKPRQHIKKQRYFPNKGPSRQGCFFLWSCIDVRVGPQRRLCTGEMILSNCGVGEDS